MSFKALTRIEQQLLQSSRHVLKQGTCSKRGVMLSSADEDIPEPDRTITKTEVERFIVDCMTKVGTEPRRAKMLAANLSEADYRGHFSHGLNRLAMYVQDTRAGICKVNNDPRILKEGPATAWVDGCNGLGVVVGTFCMEVAIRKARENGVGWVTAKGSNHFGICQWYGEMARREGFVGMAATNTSPLCTPTRAKQPVFGTNPWCVTAPAGIYDAGGVTPDADGDSFVLDMSTSSVAVGKIEMQMRKKEPLPSTGWALGSDSRPTTDPHDAFYGSGGLQPLGGEEINSGYKGYGLAMMVELLTGVMGGGDSAHHIRKWNSFDKPANLGQMFVAVDPDRFCPGMPDRVNKLVHELREMEPVDPNLPIKVPGDPERDSIAAVDARNGGIIYTPNHILTYRELAQELDVPAMEPMSSR